MMDMDVTLYAVDDNPSSRCHVAAVARSLGLPCQTYASAEELLDAYDSSWCGCLLIDLHLPGIDGLQLQQRLVTLGCVLPVIFVTGAADLFRAVRAMENGALMVLQEPCRAETLAAAIQKALKPAAALAGFSEVA